MALIPYVRVDTELATTVTWAAIQIADTGEKVNLSDFDTVKTVHNIGTGTPTISKSNDGSNFVADATLTTMAANTLKDITTAAKWYNVSANAVAASTVVLTCRKLALKV